MSPKGWSARSRLLCGATSPEAQEAGLGLSQAYGFVRPSNGHVRIYSELGEGTTIKSYLPRLIGSDEKPAELASKVRRMLDGG